jgi:hypothetical protein
MIEIMFVSQFEDAYVAASRYIYSQYNIHLIVGAGKTINKKTYLYPYKGFDFMIHRTDGNDRLVYFIGSKRENSCIVGIASNKREIVIDSFSYFASCFDETISKKNGMNAVMGVFLKFLKKKGYQKVILEDKAMLKTKKQRVIPLSDLYFFKYGSMFYIYRYKFSFYHENQQILHDMQQKWLAIKNKYWKHRTITSNFMEYLKQYANKASNSNDELLHVVHVLPQYKRISTFLKSYTFISLDTLSHFIICLKQYYQLEYDLQLYRRMFVKYL